MVRDAPIYHSLAEYYDLTYDFKDTSAEVDRLVQIARRLRPGRIRSWLDVACGTGRHLKFLARRFECAGVDQSPEMLAVARGRLLGVPLVEADMRTFRLGRQFDVVTCLFSAIGHLDTERDLQLAFESFALHVNPGGVLLVEPWLDPAKFKTPHVSLLVRDTPSVKLARVSFSNRKGDRSLLEMHYLVADEKRGIRHEVEHDDMLLIAPQRLVSLLRATGLRPRFLARGLTKGRGLLVGVAPKGRR
jgi:SAM-dependent methyltransferase